MVGCGNSETINDYISKNYDELHQIVKNISKNNELCDELYHYCLMVLLEYDKVKMGEIVKRNHAKYFFITIVMNQWNSTTSPFYKQYRKQNIEYVEEYQDVKDDDIYDEKIDDKIAFIEDQLETQHWYVKRVIQMKTEMSYQQIKDVTGIPRSSLYSTFNKFRTETVEKYKKVNKEKNI
jgi:hypothetical protein